MPLDVALLKVLRGLEALTTGLPIREIVQLGVDIAQHATSSQIAYLHFLNEDQSTLELGVWSHDTLKTCTAVSDRHYPIAKAGIWADAARLGRPCVHNDYAGHQGKRGLPTGHTTLVRHLGMPVLTDGATRMIVGVGNKPEDYDDADVEVLDLVARRIWSVVEQRRVLEHQLDRSRRMEHLQRSANVADFEYDQDADGLRFDSMYGSLFALPGDAAPPAQLTQFLERVAPPHRDRVRDVLSAPSGRQALRIECLRHTGERYPAELMVEFRPREIGAGLIGVGTLQDVTEQALMDELRLRADHDPLTGLPNRHLLQQHLGHVGARRSGETGYAFHFIDLDEFKPVNDTLGHEAGDAVLRKVAQRLQRATRKGDLVARMGGDEFAVVQADARTPAAATGLAAKLVEALGKPMLVRNATVRVTASVGVALCLDCQRPWQQFVDAADRAMYRAKMSGGNGFRLAGDEAQP